MNVVLRLCISQYRTIDRYSTTIDETFMDTVRIIYPAIAMFLLTSFLVFKLGLTRFAAIKRGEVSMKYYRSYNEGQEPQRLHILTRHIHNHFEVPPLFYVGVILTYITDSVGLVSVVAAWLYVALRLVHSFVHLGNNNVSLRFASFAASMMALAVLWLAMLFALV